jgi:hypothetical protein
MLWWEIAHNRRKIAGKSNYWISGGPRRGGFGAAFPLKVSESGWLKSTFKGLSDVLAHRQLERAGAAIT